MDKHFKTKVHLNNVDGKDKDNFISKLYLRICEAASLILQVIVICNTRYDNKKKHVESEQHNKNIKEKKLVDEKWRDKFSKLGLDHNVKHNRIIISSSDYEASEARLLEALEAMHNIRPHIKCNTFDVVPYTNPTDDKLEENEFSFRLMTRQYNGPYDLDMLNGELETRMQEQEMNQSGWSMQRFIKRTMYIHRFFSSDGCTTKVPFTCRYIYIINIILIINVYYGVLLFVYILLKTISI